MTAALSALAFVLLFVAAYFWLAVGTVLVP